MPPVAVDEFQDAIGELAARTGEAADTLLSRISVLSPAEARAFITDAYPALLAPYLAASNDLTVQWYAEQPAAERRPGAAVFTPVAAPMRSGEQLAISGRWALSTPSPATALRGNATRQVMNQSRDTVIVNAEREGVRWIRKAKPNACGFCKMLATRAAKDLSQYSYKSEGVRRKLDRFGNPTGDYTLTVIGKRGRTRGKRKLGSEYHDHCRCTAVPIRDGSYEPPDYVQQWTEEYDAIVKEHGTGDLLKISNLMDAGRVRPDRVRGALQDGADLFTATAATDVAAPAPAAATPTERPAIDLTTPGATDTTMPVEVLKRYSRIDPYVPDAGITAEEFAPTLDYMRAIETKLKTEGFDAFKNRPVLSIGADGKYAVIEDGNHRIWAAGRAGFDDIPVTVVTGEDSAWAKQYGFPIDDETRQILTTGAKQTDIAPPVDLDAPATKKPPRTFDQVEADLQAAIEAGDDAAVDRLADELEAVEAAERKAVERAAKAKARREAIDRDKWDRVGALIDEGYDPVEAESDVFGISMEKIRRRNFIAESRADGHRGAGFDELLTSVYEQRVYELYLQAESATRGVLFNRQTMNRYGPGGIDPVKLWTANEATARKWMSPELAEWFDQNGRLTKSALRNMILDGRDTWRDPMTRDFLQ